MKRKYLTISDLCQEMDICKTTAYKLIKSKKIRSGRIGKKIVVKKADLKKYMNEIMKQN